MTKEERAAIREQRKRERYEAAERMPGAYLGDMNGDTHVFICLREGESFSVDIGIGQDHATVYLPDLENIKKMIAGLVAVYNERCKAVNSVVVGKLEAVESAEV